MPLIDDPLCTGLHLQRPGIALDEGAKAPEVYEPLRHNAVGARRIDRFADHGNYRMLGHKKCVEAQTFCLTPEGHRIDTGFSYEPENSNLRRNRSRNR